MIVYGYNVAEAILKKERNCKKIRKIVIQDSMMGKFAKLLPENVKSRTFYAPKSEIDFLSKGLHQGIILEVEDIKTYSFDEIIPNITTEYPLIVILDHLEDPHNLGAIVRSSEAFGVDAIIIPNDRSVQITSTVVKTSVGTIEKVKIVNVPNINNAIRKLKDLGYWIVGTDMEGTNYTEIDYKTKIGLVIGNEGKGISKVTTSNCDYIAKIPMKGTVNSLNASVACGIFLSEINRSRGI